MKRVPGVENAADALSRLFHQTPINLNEEWENREDNICSINTKTSPISPEIIESASISDKLFTEIVHAVKTGIWSGQAAAFRGSKDKFTIWGNILYFVKRFYVPEKLRIKVLEIAHLGHVSATSMKRQPRELAWWPDMTVDANSFHAECRSCALTSTKASIPPLSPRELPLRPMDELHVDFFEMNPIPKLLVATDAYSDTFVW